MNYRGRKLDPVAVAWAAGFLDGEGCFTITVSHGRIFKPSVSAGQVDNAPLVRLRHMFGGSLSQSPAHGPHRACWRWSLEGANAMRDFLPIICEYLVGEKLAQAELLLEYANTIQSEKSGGRGRITPSAELERRMGFVNQLRLLRAS